MDVEQPVIDDPTEVLVVDDDELLADLLAEWVREKWHCTAVTSGADAVDVVDAGYDVVLLDRQMPGMCGEEVLEAIRDAELPVQVMMVSGVSPDLDLVELAIDDYLQKPADRPSLQSKIEGLLIRRTFHPIVQRFYTCAAKLSLLESTLTPDELAADERYLALKVRADELRQEADATLGRQSYHAERLSDVQADD